MNFSKPYNKYKSKKGILVYSHIPGRMDIFIEDLLKDNGFFLSRRSYCLQEFLSNFDSILEKSANIGMFSNAREAVVLVGSLPKNISKDMERMLNNLPDYAPFIIFRADEPYFSSKIFEIFKESSDFDHVYLKRYSDYEFKKMIKTDLLSKDISISGDAISLISSVCDGDPVIWRNELLKICLLKDKENEVSLDEIEHLCSESGIRKTKFLINFVFPSLDCNLVLAELSKLEESGESIVNILRYLRIVAIKKETNFYHNNGNLSSFWTLNSLSVFINNLVLIEKDVRLFSEKVSFDRLRRTFILVSRQESSINN